MWWSEALKLDPGYLEAAEHLATLFCGQKRQYEAVDLIDGVLQHLKADADCMSSLFQPGRQDAFNLPSIPHLSVSRLLGLMHAKANILYALHDHVPAAMAFDTTISLAAGLPDGSSVKLVQTIIGRLLAHYRMPSTSAILLLSPYEALGSLQACFGLNYALPGLTSLAAGPALRTAMSITSNCLLSLAKIYQDACESGRASETGLLVSTTNNGRLVLVPSQSRTQLPQRFSIAEVLTLYYLSMSLQPSASTANNVGILLASLNNPFSGPATLPSSTGGRSGETGTALAARYYEYGISLDPHHAHL